MSITLKRNTFPADISSSDEDMEIMLYSQTGLVRTKQSNLLEQTVQIDTAGLSNGLYTLVVVRNGQIVQAVNINVRQ